MGIDLEGSPLYKAVIQRKIDGVRSSLANKVFSWDFADNDEDDYIFRRTLKEAIEFDQQDTLEVMLQAHFGDTEYGDGNSKPYYITEALETAAWLGKQNIVAWLLETEKANIHNISNALAYGTWSKNLQILQLLIDAGANPNYETEWGIPLIAAARTGDLRVVQFLIEASADPNMEIETDGFSSPLVAAAYEGYEKVCEYLLPLTVDEEAIEFVRKELPRRATGRKRREL
ncbi:MULTISPECIES: ankyrin repeat domain-containing protein [unclassified Leptolyngbya]|uniref:ankyrin repeat domain-containing protein n=1 Tax=unclassified Leptolyngbya TaxID=2650499 RepID=UPI0016868A8C|nr:MULTISPECIES: ankyrin repeat domain-containing protein [unclassified Leptolyngbya]MBD1913769.1 ankyrin repeat domain-containing protein [Leptolyngbya sp. FACHB-8]MBD2153000.1 ankyrin repeat domain-containing protein [Leptolyngbya sp. FACHB-16]